MTVAMEGNVHAPCPACGSESVGSLFRKDGHRYARCGTCGLVHVNPRPPAEELAAIYDHYGAGYFTSSRKLAIDFSPLKYEKEMAFFRRHAAPGPTLDIGCATGSFLAALRDLGMTATGIDIAGPSVEFGCSQGLDAVRGDFLVWPFPERGFANVTLWASLEHVPEPRRFLERAHVLLREGGCIFITVPNFASLTQAVLGRRNRYVGVEHLNYFDVASLGRLLERTGFEVFAAETRGFNPIQIYRDLKGGEVTVEEMVDLSEKVDRIRTSPVLVLLRKLHRVVERAIGTVYRGDILYMAARKRFPSDYCVATSLS
jgi:SAM-dependent methyltransferase